MKITNKTTTGWKDKSVGEKKKKKDKQIFKVHIFMLK